jgi:hypothetical protein
VYNEPAICPGIGKFDHVIGRAGRRGFFEYFKEPPMANKSNWTSNMNEVGASQRSVNNLFKVAGVRKGNFSLKANILPAAGCCFW